MGSDAIFKLLSPRRKKATTLDHNPARDEIMPKPQTHQAANATSITAHSTGTAADGHIQPAISNVSPYGRIYALVIGINDYVYLPRLAGAVNDARAVEEFLKSWMNVPSDRIRLLLDRDASRRNIVTAFSQLSKDSEINRGDPILIYYAGHGTELKAPSGWEAGGPGRKIQGICPCDYGSEDVNAIPDRTIGGYLDLICEKKGNNITVILDCCHSASGTREGELSTNVRGVILDDKLPLDLDLQELSVAIARGLQIKAGFGVRGLASHVLISACKESEKAREEGKQGRFTAALLDLLKKEGRLETLTYTDILKHIKPITGQNPQVEGIHRERIIFHSKAAHPRHLPFYSVRFKPADRVYTLDAGSVHGIAIGSQFTIYENDDSFLKSSPWGVLVVASVKSSTSVLSHPEGTSGPDLINPSIAILCVGSAEQSLCILASYDAKDLSTTFREAIQQSEKQGIISLVENNGVLKMRLENDHLLFDILDPSVNACGMDQVYESVNPTHTTDDVARILSAGSHFFWHLKRGHKHPIIDQLSVEFAELNMSEDDFDSTGCPIYFSSGENLLRDGVIDLNIYSDVKPYGIKLTNNSEWDLFPVAFYFDHSDWSIHEFYHPGTAGQFEADAPLRRQGGTLTIGYGAGGRDPISFELRRPNQDLDVGHLKLFFMTKSTDLRHIKQESPFTGTRQVTSYSRSLDTWVALQYPIIQRRA